MADWSLDNEAVVQVYDKARWRDNLCDCMLFVLTDALFRASSLPQWAMSCARRNRSSCLLGPAGVYKKTPSLAVAMRAESPRNAQLCRFFSPAAQGFAMC